MQLLAYMASAEYTVLLDRLVEAARNPALGRRVPSSVKKLNRLVRRPWRRLAKAVNRLPDDPPDEMLHAVRIRAKRARYAAEAVAPGFGRPARRFARRAKRLQRALGVIQDAAVAHEWLLSWSSGREDPQAVFVAGQLAGLEIARRSAARSAWQDAWWDLDRSRTRGGSDEVHVGNGHPHGDQRRFLLLDPAQPASHVPKPPLGGSSGSPERLAGSCAPPHLNATTGYSCRDHDRCRSTTSIGSEDSWPRALIDRLDEALSATLREEIASVVRPCSIPFRSPRRG